MTDDRALDGRRWTRDELPFSAKSYDRAARKFDKIRARLGWDLGLEECRADAERIHRKTYERLSAWVWELTDEAVLGFADQFAFALLKMDPKPGDSADL